jgi:hypothetical protein
VSRADRQRRYAEACKGWAALSEAPNTEEQINRALAVLEAGASQERAQKPADLFNAAPNRGVATPGQLEPPELAPATTGDLE